MDQEKEQKEPTRDEVLAAGGPFITMTLESGNIKVMREMTLADAEELAKDLFATIHQTKLKYEVD